MVNNASLHYSIIRYVIEHGHAPDVDQLATILQSEPAAVESGLLALQEYHGVVLHPHEVKVWVIHPFALSATNFLVKSARGEWWGNCAWCSLGVAALLDEDVSITTSYGAHGEQVVVNIIDGQVQEKELYVHFPIPMKRAWDNVIYTCSNMLIFKNEEQVDLWSKRHNIPKGDVQPIARIWEFSKEWYGGHLDPDWRKLTMQEAQAMFKKYGLTHEIWQLEAAGQRF